VPDTPPAVPEHVVQVPDNSSLEPGSAYTTFTVELRYRTKEKFGNIAQKGQATTPGGQWKIQNPLGRPSCLFKGSIGRTATRVPVALNDNQWHVLTCVLTRTRVTAYVDGVEVNHHNGGAGTIDNSFPMAVGGKTDCDQIVVTCDYYAGMIDYLRISRE
jgi:Concanavalin A-like lectin/glucanases superfamily